jgi:hypothetical protein
MLYPAGNHRSSLITKNLLHLILAARHLGFLHRRIFDPGPLYDNPITLA